jgi:glycerophosphoryl diester phosphodiesterase
MRRLILFGLIALGGFLALTPLGPQAKVNSSGRQFQEAPDGLILIAHAGGGLPEGIYANSLQAMDLAVSNGFDLIEIDLSWTSDGALVAIHDWQDSFAAWFSLPPMQWVRDRLGMQLLVPELATFNAMFMKDDQQQLDLDALMIWLKQHPDIRLITDIKEDNLTALRHIALNYPDLIPQIIPEITKASRYDLVVGLGWTDIIFATYRSKLSNAEIIRFANENPLFALAIPRHKITNGRYLDFVELGTPLFTHTVNDPAYGEELQDLGFEGVYTEYLYPPG